MLLEVLAFARMTSFAGDEEIPAFAGILMRKYFAYNLIEKLNLKGIISTRISLLHPIPAKAGISLSPLRELSTDSYRFQRKLEPPNH